MLLNLVPKMKLHTKLSYNGRNHTILLVMLVAEKAPPHLVISPTDHWVLLQRESCEKLSQPGIVYECRPSSPRWRGNMHVHSYLYLYIHTWALQHIVSSSWCSLFMLHGSGASNKRDKISPPLTQADPGGIACIFASKLYMSLINMR